MKDERLMINEGGNKEEKRGGKSWREYFYRYICSIEKQKREQET